MTAPSRKATAAATAGVSLLTAIVALYSSGAIQRWTWTPPTTGSEAVKYRVQVEYIVPANQTYLLMAFKDSVWVKVAGIDSLGRQGEWSVASDTLEVGK